MAEATSDLSTSDNLERKILQALSDARGPVKTALLVKKCQVPKKAVNQVLYRLKEEGKVSPEGPATWRLAGEGPEDAASEVSALQSSPASRSPGHGADTAGAVLATDKTSSDLAPSPQHEASAILESTEERICRFLTEHGPQRALHIAQALGMRTAKEVNPVLYAMRNRHLLSYHDWMWSIYESGHREGPRRSVPIVYQQNWINMNCQQGPNSHIHISNSEAIQIGHNNNILCNQIGPRLPFPLSVTKPEDPSTQGDAAKAWGPQDISVERSLLRRVQVGHCNEMSLSQDPAAGSTHSFSSSPPVSATADDPGGSFEVRMPEPGPHPEGDVAQRVRIKSCLMEDTTIGNSNKMTLQPSSEGPDGVAESQHDRRDAGKRKEGPNASSEATQCRSTSPPPRNITQLTPTMRAVTLGDSDPHTAEAGLEVPGAAGAGSRRQQAS